jgi:hypothetical protein
MRPLSSVIVPLKLLMCICSSLAEVSERATISFSSSGSCVAMAKNDKRATNEFCCSRRVTGAAELKVRYMEDAEGAMEDIVRIQCSQVTA